MPKVPTVSLLEEIDEHRRKQGPKCGIALTLATMPTDLATQFQQLLDADLTRAPHSAVSRMMRSKGYAMVTDNCVRRHRGGDCGCTK
jgi:hypothetical protein